MPKRTNEEILAARLAAVEETQAKIAKQRVVQIEKITEKRAAAVTRRDKLNVAIEDFDKQLAALQQEEQILGNQPEVGDATQLTFSGTGAEQV